MSNPNGPAPQAGNNTLPQHSRTAAPPSKRDFSWLFQLVNTAVIAGAVIFAAKSLGNGVENAGKHTANGVENAGKHLANGVENAGKHLANGVENAGKHLANGVEMGMRGLMTEDGAGKDLLAKGLEDFGKHSPFATVFDKDRKKLQQQ